MYNVSCERGEHSAVIRVAMYEIRTRTPGSPSVPSLRGRQIGTRIVWEDKNTDLIFNSEDAEILAKLGGPGGLRTSDYPFRGLTSYPRHHATPAVCLSLSLLNHIGGVISYQQSTPLTGLTW